MPDLKGPYKPVGKGREGLATRQVAAAILEKIVDGGQSLDSLCDEQHGHARWRALIAKDRALSRAIVTVALRHRRHIDCALLKALDRNLPAKARHLLATLHVAAAQIFYMKVPESAAVNLAVTSLREDRRSARFSKLGNAVLRRVARERESILEDCDDWQLAFPQWLARRVRTDFGLQKAHEIALGVLAPAPLDITPSPVLQESEVAALAKAVQGVLLPTGTIRVFHDVPVRGLAGYDEGKWWIQDAAAALPVRLLGPVAGLNVADLCAAPGGKTAQLAAAGANVTAVDRSAARLGRLRDNLARLSLAARIVEADILQWQPDCRFDAVLLDAPCSATGTLRRNPDVAWIRTPEAVDELVELQKKMLAKAIEITAPGGVVIYANCSMLKQEGEDIAAELVRSEAVEIEPIDSDIVGIDGLINGQGALRTLPCDQPGEGTTGGMDGFFAARFSKVGAA